MPVIVSSSVIDRSQSLTSLYHELEMEYPKFFKMDDLCKASILGAEMVLRKAGMADNEPKKDMGVVLMNGSSSIDTDLRFVKSISQESYYPSPSLFSYTLANIMTGEICIRYKIYGESSLYICEEFRPDELVRVVGWTFRDPLCSRCLCGWADCLNGRADVLMMLVAREGEGPAFSADTLNELYGIYN